jgi:hypothetical protein
MPGRGSSQLGLRQLAQAEKLLLSDGAIRHACSAIRGPRQGRQVTDIGGCLVLALTLQGLLSMANTGHDTNTSHFRWAHVPVSASACVCLILICQMLWGRAQCDMLSAGAGSGKGDLMPGPCHCQMVLSKMSQ